MDVHDRAAAILRRLDATGRVLVSELATQLAVSEMTVRRDLEALERQSLLKRVHGGAISTVSRSFEPPFAARTHQAADAKRRIAATVSELIQPGETVLLDGGTTLLAVAGRLAQRANLTACPLSVPAARALFDRPGIRLLLVGGEVRPGEGTIAGPLAQDSLADLHFDTFVMAAGGVDPERGITDFHLDDVALKQVALKSANRCLLAVDSTKLGRVAFATVTGPHLIDTLITDQDADPTLVSQITELGIEVITT